MQSNFRYSLTVKVLLLFSMVSFLSSCEDDDTNTDDNNPYYVELSNYDELEIRGSSQVSICNTCDFDLNYIGDQDDYENLSASVTDNRLTINGSNGQIILGNPNLRYIELKGSSSLSGDTIIHPSHTLEIHASGNSSASLLVLMDDVSIFTTGTANIVLSGVSSNLHFETNGSSTINSLGIDANNAFASLSGSGLIELHTSDSLYARVNGSGTIHYSGNPIVVDSEVTGSGAIIEIP